MGALVRCQVTEFIGSSFSPTSLFPQSFACAWCGYKIPYRIPNRGRTFSARKRLNTLPNKSNLISLSSETEVIKAPDHVSPHHLHFDSFVNGGEQCTPKFVLIECTTLVIS